MPDVNFSISVPPFDFANEFMYLYSDQAKGVICAAVSIYGRS